MLTALRGIRSGTSAAAGVLQQVWHRQYAAMAEFSRDYDVNARPPRNVSAMCKGESWDGGAPLSPDAAGGVQFAAEPYPAHIPPPPPPPPPRPPPRK